MFLTESEKRKIVIDINIIDSKPVRLKPYNLNTSDRNELNKILDKWLEKGGVRKSNSCLVSPIFLVKRKETSRDEIEYSLLNKRTLLTIQPTPVMEAVKTSPSESSIYSIRDLYSSYLQLALLERSKHYTALVSPREHMEFIVLPFGLNCGSYVSSEVTIGTLYDLQNVGLQWYFDDMVLVSKSVEEHKCLLRKFLERFRARNISLS